MHFYLLLLSQIFFQSEFSSAPVWADEFNVEGLPDASKWSYDVGRGADGWGNKELQYYTEKRAENAYVSNGTLKIRAIKEEFEGSQYTSARLVSKKKGDFRYGRFEVRAKVPEGRGTWPAAWMLPSDNTYGGWPRSGEIDILEHVGYDPDVVHISVHTLDYHHSIGTQKTAFRKIDDARSKFHTYRVDWTPKIIRGYVDDQLLFEFKNEGKGPNAWPFDQSFHWILNLAVGGFWGGQKGVDESVFPAEYEVDYVRVYGYLGQ